MFPSLLARIGVAVAPWVDARSWRSAAGGVLGYLALAQIVAPATEPLLAASRPDRAAATCARCRAAARAPRFPDETGDLACGSAARCVDEPARARRAACRRRRPRVARSAEELTRSAEAPSRRRTRRSRPRVGDARARRAQQQRAARRRAAAGPARSPRRSSSTRAARARPSASPPRRTRRRTPASTSRGSRSRRCARVFERVEQARQQVFQLEAKTRHVHQITEIITSVAHAHEPALAERLDRGGARRRGGPRLLGGGRRDPQARRERGAQRRGDREADPRDRVRHAARSPTGMRESSKVIGEGREDVEHDRATRSSRSARRSARPRAAPRRSSRRPTRRRATPSAWSSRWAGDQTRRARNAERDRRGRRDLARPARRRWPRWSASARRSRERRERAARARCAASTRAAEGRAVSADAPERERLLTFEIGVVAVRAADRRASHEVAEMAELAAVPTLPRDVGGVMNYHGDALPVVHRERAARARPPARSRAAARARARARARTTAAPRAPRRPHPRPRRRRRRRRRAGPTPVAERRPLDGRMVQRAGCAAPGRARARKAIEDARRAGRVRTREAKHGASSGRR